MHVSRQKLPSKRKQDLVAQLCRTLATMNDPSQVHSFLKDFLSSSEYLALGKRLHIGQMLETGSSYEEIAKRLKVSTATISAIAEAKQKAGWQLGLATLAKPKSWSKISPLNLPKWGKISPWRKTAPKLST